MSHVGAASLAAFSPARAAASRKNGAKSRGPKSPEGKARSARNALKHGLCAQKYVALGDEDLTAFDAFEAALLQELAPRGALQTVLARRVVAAAWRLERAERIEAEVFARHLSGTTSFGLAMIRDGNGARAFDTLLRYRGTTLAEFWRALRILKALQAEGAEARAEQGAAAAIVREVPIKPERRGIAGDYAPAPAAGAARAGRAPRRPARAAAPAAPSEPESRADPGGSVPSMPRGMVERGGGAALLATTSLVPPDRPGSP